MGSSTSIAKYIYISSDTSFDRGLDKITEKLEEFNITIVNNNINYIENASYIIIFISPNTIRSVKQIQDIQKCWEHNKNIIYVMEDSKYTPDHITELSGFIKNSLWYPYYDKETISTTIDSIVKNILKKN